MKKWWQDKTIYQIYPKSFYDSNGDGIGDLQGIISRLDYLKELGIDILWISPCYRSPMIDQGYDISDYYSIDPMFGTMEDMECLLRETKRRDMYVILDLVVNHCSAEHAWFREACRDPEGRYGKYFYIEDAQDGKNPSNWRSYFGGPVWSPLPGHPGKVYYHSFHEKQPDLNWENPEVRKEIFEMVNWWLDKGLAGFRIDAILNIKKKLPFCDYEPDQKDGLCSLGAMLSDVVGVTDFLNEMKRETFSPHDAFTVAEVAGEKNEDIPLYIGENGCFGSMFDFHELAVGAGRRGWFDRKETTAEQYIQACYEAQALFNPWGMAANVIENHDNPRGVSRFIPSGERSAAARKMLGALYFFMKGIPCIYQGQELGMENYPFETIDEMDDVSAINEYRTALAHGFSEDKAFRIAADFSRDNARTPMQWDDRENAGFSAADPWLPVNPNYKMINAKQQRSDPDSVYQFYRAMISLRKDPLYRETLVYGSFSPVESGDPKLMIYLREGDRRILVAGNFQNRLTLFEVPGTIKTILLNNMENLRSEGNVIHMEPYQAVLVEI